MVKALVVMVMVATGGFMTAVTAHDRAVRQELEAANATLAAEVQRDASFAARRVELERRGRDLDECEPAFARILPSREVATDEQLLRTVQDMADTAHVRIVSVEIQ
ncbi:MAG TPA: hypothetical protein VFF73_11700 [Planctomycetota bacterium]|nr:hypothetical protein [Planctomycetota bacterium]